MMEQNQKNQSSEAQMQKQPAIDVAKLEAELEFLEDWIRFALEPAGLECCGRGDGYECCGNHDVVPTSPSDWLKSMQARHAEVQKLLTTRTSSGEVKTQTFDRDI